MPFGATPVKLHVTEQLNMTFPSSETISTSGEVRMVNIFPTTRSVRISPPAGIQPP